MVQIDFHRDALLVSSTRQCGTRLLLPFLMPNLRSEIVRASSEAEGGLVCTRVGTKDRDGAYGAAFHASGVVFAARPGKRVWRADARAGTVQATYNFTPSLKATPPAALLEPAWRSQVEQSFPARTQPVSCFSGTWFARLTQ